LNKHCLSGVLISGPYSRNRILHTAYHIVFTTTNYLFNYFFCTKFIKILLPFTDFFILPFRRCRRDKCFQIIIPEFKLCHISQIFISSYTKFISIYICSSFKNMKCTHI
jgi:hypothetical protein